MLDRADIQMALVCARYYMRAHQLRQRTPDLAAFRLADRLERLLMAASGRNLVGAQEHLLTVQQVSQATGLSERQSRRIAARVGRKIGRQWFVPADALEEDN